MRTTALENKSEGPFTVTVALLRVPPHMSKAIPFEEIVKFAFPALGASKNVTLPAPFPAPWPIMNVPFPAVELLWKATVALVKTPFSALALSKKSIPVLSNEALPAVAVSLKERLPSP
jgi:hypothetical protein